MFSAKTVVANHAKWLKLNLACIAAYVCLSVLPAFLPAFNGCPAPNDIGLYLVQALLTLCVMLLLVIGTIVYVFVNWYRCDKFSAKGVLDGFIAWAVVVVAWVLLMWVSELLDVCPHDLHAF